MLFNPLYLLLSLVLLMKNIEETTSKPMEVKRPSVPDKKCEATHVKRRILYVVDGSESVGQDNFNLVKEVLQQLSSKFEVSPDKTQIALMQFGEATQTHIEFNLGEKNTLITVNQGVDAMNYLSSQGRDTGDALLKAIQQVFNGEDWDRSTAANVLILFTVGPATDSSQLAIAQQLKTAGVKIITVGIGGQQSLALSRPNLEAMASVDSEPGQVLHFEADFDNLDDLTCQIVNKV